MAKRKQSIPTFTAEEWAAIMKRQDENNDRLRAEFFDSLPAPKKGNKTCLCCQKEIKVLEDFSDEHKDSILVDDAGFIEISFHYGSRYDHCAGHQSALGPVPAEDDPDHKIRQLTHCDMVQAYICDDCARDRAGLMEGYRTVSFKLHEHIDLDSPPDQKRVYFRYPEHKRVV
jgi:hypothetical protein